MSTSLGLGNIYNEIHMLRKVNNDKIIKLISVIDTNE